MLQYLHKNIYLRKFYFDRTEMEKWLIISCMFSLLLVMSRVIVTGNLTFLFLAWNLFLAYVPYFISRKLEQSPRLVENIWKFALVFIVWLLFIPNSFYILTDLFHVDDLKGDRPRWFDLTLILSFAWNGLLLGILSVRQMEKIFLYCLHIRNRFFFLYPVMWLNALGIYIGRYMRFNSWDVVTNPFQLLGDIGNMLLHPFQHIYPWGMICCFSVLMTIIYMSVQRMAKML
jgi:uncharacterized membrane protein